MNNDDLPQRCVDNLRKLDLIESRLDRVEVRIDGIEDLKTLVQLLADRIKLILWLTGVATGGVILGVIGMFFAYLQGGVR